MEPIEEWSKPIFARGPRPEFEMEQVMPGADSGDPFEDPIIESNELKDAGDLSGAKKILMDTPPWEWPEDADKIFLEALILAAYSRIWVLAGVSLRMYSIVLVVSAEAVVQEEGAVVRAVEEI